MSELIQFFIETSSLSGEHLAGMLFAGVVVLSILCVAAYQILDLITKFLKSTKWITIKKVEKVEKIVEVPKYMDNSKEYKEILATLKRIEDNQSKVQL